MNTFTQNVFDIICKPNIKRYLKNIYRVFSSVLTNAATIYYEISISPPSKPFHELRKHSTPI